MSVQFFGHELRYFLLCNQKLHVFACNIMLKHLPNVETRFYCPEAFLSLVFHCRMDVSELK